MGIGHEGEAFSLNQGEPDKNQLEVHYHYCHKRFEDGPEKGGRETSWGTHCSVSG